MSVQHTNFNTSQDKDKTGQEFNNQELIKNNSPDNRLASILLAVAFYLAIVYLALFLLLGLSNPWGMVSLMRRLTRLIRPTIPLKMLVLCATSGILTMTSNRLFRVPTLHHPLQHFRFQLC